MIVIDLLSDYTDTLKELFDFESMRALFQSGFRLQFDAMHGVTGLYGRHIFEKILQPLINAAQEIFQIRWRFRREHPTVIT